MSLIQHRNLVPYMEGCLAKRLRPKFCNWWRNFWFLLNGKTLFCFKNRQESELQRKLSHKEFLNFTNVHAVRPIHNSSSKFSFEIVTRKSTVILAASTEEMRKKWIEALQSALLLSIISSPIIKKKCTNPHKSQFFGNKEYSLSQPDLSKRVCVTDDYSPQSRGRRASLMTSHRPGSNNSYNPIEMSASMTLCDPPKTRPKRDSNLTTTVFNLNRNRQYPSTAADSSAAFRCTAAEFFTSDQKVNWPSLSMDIQDEIFREIIHQHVEMKRMLKRDPRTSENDGLVAATATSLSEIGTQTEFSDESCESDDDDGGGSEEVDCPCDCYEDSSSS